MKKLIKISSIALAILAGPANASMEDFVDHGSYTTDTKSKLDWLDVTETGYKSYNEVTSELGSGARLEGWRYATGIEFNQMLSNYTGVSFPDAGYGRVNLQDGLIDGNFFNLFGSTSDLDRERLRQSDDQLIGQTFITGLLADPKTFDSPNRPTDMWVAYIFDIDKSVDGANQKWNDHTQAHYIHKNKNIRAIQSRIFASFLVRDADPDSLPAPVPLPATVWLMGSGLLGLIGITQKRRNKQLTV